MKLSQNQIQELIKKHVKDVLDWANTSLEDMKNSLPKDSEKVEYISHRKPAKGWTGRGRDRFQTDCGTLQNNGCVQDLRKSGQTRGARGDTPPIPPVS